MSKRRLSKCRGVTKCRGAANTELAKAADEYPPGFRLEPGVRGCGSPAACIAHRWGRAPCEDGCERAHGFREP